MIKRNPFSPVTLETFAVNTAELDAEVALARDVSEFVAISLAFSVATGHRDGGDPVVFIRSFNDGMHAVVCPDVDEGSIDDDAYDCD